MECGLCPGPAPICKGSVPSRRTPPAPAGHGDSLRTGICGVSKAAGGWKLTPEPLELLGCEGSVASTSHPPEPSSACPALPLTGGDGTGAGATLSRHPRPTTLPTGHVWTSGPALVPWRPEGVRSRGAQLQHLLLEPLRQQGTPEREDPPYFQDKEATCRGSPPPVPGIWAGRGSTDNLS